MKKIIAIILVITTIGILFTGCAKEEEIEAVKHEKVTVDVSLILENKSIFENRIASNNEQEKFKTTTIALIEKIDNGEITDFTVTFSEELFSSWEECNNYAEAIEPGKTHLGSWMHYILWLAQRIINDEVEWEEICNEEKVLPTIAFREKNCWVGSCVTKCLMSYSDISTEAYVHGANFHAFADHNKWQAFVIESVEGV